MDLFPYLLKEFLPSRDIFQSLLLKSPIAIREHNERTVTRRGNILPDSLIELIGGLQEVPAICEEARFSDRDYHSYARTASKTGDESATSITVGQIF